MTGALLHIVVAPAGAAGPLPASPALADAAGATRPWPDAWPLGSSAAFAREAAALALLKPAGEAAILWDSQRLDAAEMAELLVRVGIMQVRLHPVAGAQAALAELDASLQQAAISVQTGNLLPPCPAIADNLALQDALPFLVRHAQAAGLATTRQRLLAAAAMVIPDLVQPRSPDPATLAMQLWEHLDRDILRARSYPFDAASHGPAGLTGRRIAFVIDRLAGRSGGAERVLVQTANALAVRGHDVEILVHEVGHVAPFYPLAAGVRLTNLKPARAMRPRWRRALDMVRAGLERVLPDMYPFDRLVWFSRHGAFSARLGRHLSIMQSEVAVAFMPPAMTALARARVPAGMRRVASTHNVPRQDFENPARWDPSPLDRERRKAGLQKFDAITVLLDEFRAWYPADLQPRVHVLPNAVEPVKTRPLHGPVSQKFVLAVGRLAAVKRHDVLIDAFARIASDFPDWHLRIYGDGSLRDDLGLQIATTDLVDRIHLMGHRQTIADAYAQAAFLAHPAEFEGFGLAVAEGLAAGLPVVGFADCPGLNQLVHHGQNGLLVQSEPTRAARVDAFALALAQMLSDDALRNRLAAAAPASVAQYAPDKVTAMWEHILLAPEPAFRTTYEIHPQQEKV